MLFVFDFDGVLVDSYSCLPSIYEKLAKYFGIKSKKFVKEGIALEDKYDAMGIYDRQKWWQTFFKKYGVMDISNALQIFWEERIKRSKLMENCIEILEWLEKKHILAIVAGNDGIKSMKRKRIEKSGLSPFFNDILIVGEDVNSKVDGILYLMKKYKLEERDIVFIDDKPSPINEVKNKLRNVIAMRIKYTGILKLAWKKKCNADFKIKKLEELKNYFS